MLLANVQPSDSGLYYVTISNLVGTVASQGAYLTVLNSNGGGGSVLFENKVVLVIIGAPRITLVDAPVFAADGKTPLEGAGYLAQLFAGTNANALEEVGEAVPFSSGPRVDPGYWNASPNPARFIPSVPPGEVATVQVRVWEAAKGATFEAAQTAGSLIGLSTIFTVKTGGTTGSNAAPAALKGLHSFSLAGSSQPLITLQPLNHLLLRPGRTATFMVSASSSTPLSYQWQKLILDGHWQDIVGAIYSSLVLTNIQPGDAGDYQVVVRNASGSVTSRTSHLRVPAPPRFSTADLKKLPGGGFQFSLSGADQLDYRIDISSNLVDWLPFSTLTNFDGRTPIIDRDAPKHPRDFYRSVLITPED